MSAQCFTFFVILAWLFSKRYKYITGNREGQFISNERVHFDRVVAPFAVCVRILGMVYGIRRFQVKITREESSVKAL